MQDWSQHEWRRLSEEQPQETTARRAGHDHAASTNTATWRRAEQTSSSIETVPGEASSIPPSEEGDIDNDNELLLLQFPPADARSLFTEPYTGAVCIRVRSI